MSRGEAENIIFNSTPTPTPTAIPASTEYGIALKIGVRIAALPITDYQIKLTLLPAQQFPSKLYACQSIFLLLELSTLFRALNLEL